MVSLRDSEDLGRFPFPAATAAAFPRNARRSRLLTRPTRSPPAAAKMSDDEAENASGDPKCDACGRSGPLRECDLCGDSACGRCFHDPITRDAWCDKCRFVICFHCESSVDKQDDTEYAGACRNCSSQLCRKCVNVAGNVDLDVQYCRDCYKEEEASQGCVFILVKGERKGKQCGKPKQVGKSFCYAHKTTGLTAAAGGGSGDLADEMGGLRV